MKNNALEEIINQRRLSSDRSHLVRDGARRKEILESRNFHIEKAMAKILKEGVKDIELDAFYLTKSGGRVHSMFSFSEVEPVDRDLANLDLEIEARARMYRQDFSEMFDQLVEKRRREQYRKR